MTIGISVSAICDVVSNCININSRNVWMTSSSLSNSQNNANRLSVIATLICILIVREMQWISLHLFSGLECQVSWSVGSQEAFEQDGKVHDAPRVAAGSIVYPLSGPPPPEISTVSV